MQCGLDIVADGEMSKPGFFSYVQERLTGFEPRPGKGPRKFAAEFDAFPEYYEEYFKRAMMGGSVAPPQPLFCIGPVSYCGQEALHKDIANLKAALGTQNPDTAFMPSVAPSGVGTNAYYKNDEEFFFAVGEALRTEYLAIVEAGFLLQIDDPFLSEIFIDLKADPANMRRTADLYVETTNHALRGIAPEKVRFHTCYGINEGPRIHEAAMSEVVGHMLRVNAGTYSFEAANARHEHEYHLWEKREAARRQEADAGRDHPCRQHCRASRADRRTAHPFCGFGRARERDCRRRLRLLLAGDLQDRSASEDHVDQVRGDGRGREDRVGTIVGMRAPA